MVTVSLEQLQIKRHHIMEQLQSDEHYAATDTLVYGTHDPLRVSIPPCDSCGGQAALDKPQSPKPRWSIMCPRCNKTIQSPQAKPWRAALMWCERNLGSMDYRDLPLFGLSQLNPREARARMVGIKHNLELRRRLIGLDRAIAAHTHTGHPGRGYEERMEAYVKWAALALRLIKHAERIEQEGRRPAHQRSA